LYIHYYNSLYLLRFFSQVLRGAENAILGGERDLKKINITERQFLNQP
jgi:hypothetical protein